MGWRGWGQRCGGESQNRALLQESECVQLWEEQGGGAKVWKRGAGGSAVTKQSIREGRHVWPPKGLRGEAGEKPLCS